MILEIEADTTSQGDTLALKTLTVMVFAAKAVLSVITIAGAIFFAIPTLAGSTEVWSEGNVSGLPMGGDLPMEAPTAETVAEQLDLPGTDRLGRFVIEGDQGNAQINAIFQPARFIYTDPSLALRLVVVAAAAATTALLWTALSAISGLLKTCRNGDPFAKTNINRIRTLGAAALAYQIAVFAFPALKNTVAPTASGLDQMMFHPTTNPTLIWFAVAAACFALAEVFAHGRDLHLADLETV